MTDPTGDGRDSADELPTRRSRREQRAQEHRHPLLRRTSFVLVGVLVLVLGLGTAAYLKLTGNITRLDVSKALGKDRPDANQGKAASGPLNIMVLGSDTRTGKGNTAYGDGSWEPGAHSDTNLLVHLSGDRESVTVVSIPRDSMVKAPRDCKATTPKSQWEVRMWNANFNLGGPACSMIAFEGNTDIYVNHFVVVDFNGFKDMVDALGGVPVCLKDPIDDPNGHLKLSAGRHHLNGEQALGYVRVRKTLGDGSDLGRIKRQQAFMSSVAQEATKTSLLLRPDKLYRFLDAATQSLTTDEQFGLGDMKDLAESVKDIGVKNIQFVTVPTQQYEPDHNRVEWTPDAEEVWKAIREDYPVGREKKTSAASAKPLTVSPSDITVHVINAAGVSGLAKQDAAALSAQGFKATRFTSGAAVVNGVSVAYPRGQAEAARTVAAAFPRSVVREDANLTGTEIVVTLGRGAPAVVAVPNRVGTTPIPSPTVSAPAPTPVPTISQRTADQDICS